MPKTAANWRSDAFPSRPDDAAVTIGGLARSRGGGATPYGITSHDVRRLSHIAPAAASHAPFSPLLIGIVSNGGVGNNSGVDSGRPKTPWVIYAHASDSQI
jgi:hypothetical protein